MIDKRSESLFAGVLIGSLVIANVLVIGVLMLRPARGGELMLCHLEPIDAGGWHYRTKVGGMPQSCWYKGPEMKPRRELYWADAPAVAAQPDEPEFMFDQRWPHRQGWDHKE